ncbi:MAG: tetratricopeptide repeat protein, partial [Proteobacteria bacterium]|nr:tetratricopeptide repeat protein [Pseudomonadota bacterium]
MNERDESNESDADEPDLLRELGKQLPYDRPDVERREAMRAALLVRAREDVPPVRGRWTTIGGAFVAGAAAAAAVALLLARSPGTSSPTSSPTPAASNAPVAQRAQIESSSAAELEHTITPAGELVRLHAGSVHLAVGDARVTVKTGDASIVGIGAYDVSVHGDRLAAVVVTAGSATVTVDGQRAVFLAAGQTWTAPIQTADVSPIVPVPVPVPSSAKAITADPHPTMEERVARKPNPDPLLIPTAKPDPKPDPIPTATPKPDPIPMPTPSPDPPPPPAPVGVTGVRFAKGWDLLRAGKPGEAAIELGAAADAGEGDLASDARYFQAIALVRAGRKTEAERAYVQFIDRAPTSLRHGRAAVALAHLIAERGDRTSARRWYESALADVDPGVVASARAG